MNPPHSRPPEGDKPGAIARTWAQAKAWIVLFLAFGPPVLLFAVDYAYFGPIVRFGPFIAWTAAALGMAGYAASYRTGAEALGSGICAVFVAAGLLVAVVLAGMCLAIVLVAPSPALAALGAGIVGTVAVYGQRLAAVLRSAPRGAGWIPGLVAGAAAAFALPVLVQSLHDGQFESRLAGLRSADPGTRSQTLKSLVGSRFCWSDCVHAVCERRDNLDAALVREVLGTEDVDTACDDPGMSEWPG